MKPTLEDLQLFTRQQLGDYANNATYEAKQILSMFVFTPEVSKMTPLEYVAYVGEKRVLEKSVNLKDIPEFEIDVLEFGEFANILTFYIGCLLDKLWPEREYGVKLNFVKPWDRDVFEEELSVIEERLYNDDLKYVKCEWGE